MGCWNSRIQGDEAGATLEFNWIMNMENSHGISQFPRKTQSRFSMSGLDPGSAHGISSWSLEDICHSHLIPKTHPGDPWESWGSGRCPWMSFELPPTPNYPRINPCKNETDGNQNQNIKIQNHEPRTPKSFPCSLSPPSQHSDPTRALPDPQ